MSRRKKANNEPSWFGVIFAALLSVALGVVLGAALLAIKPVTIVKAPVKDEEREAGMVYYVQGSRDTAKAAAATAKRQAFLSGQSVSLTEDDLNLLAGPAPAPIPAKAPKSADKAAKPAEKPAPTPAADGAAADTIVLGTPNFRIVDQDLHVAVPTTLNLLGLAQPVIVQTRGGFVKENDMFVYVPQSITIGSLPLDRLPMASRYVRDRVINAQTISNELKVAWAKVANVAIENKTLKLTMP